MRRGTWIAIEIEIWGAEDAGMGMKKAATKTADALN
jgi:hypothetical protein